MRIPHDTTKIFTEIFENADSFLDGWKASGLYEESLVADSSVKKLFFLVYSRYGNSAIANLDVSQFMYRVYAIIFQFAPAWEKKLEVQKKLRDLSDEELMKGSKAIYNHAFNPSQEPSTCTLEEISTINDQNTTNYKKSRMEGYAMLMELLENDVTEYILSKFKPLFATFVYTRPDLFITEEEEE